MKSLGQKSAASAEEHLRLLLAAKLYERGELSIGQAAELYGVPKLAFMTKLSEIGVPIINLDESELKAELRFG